MALSTVVPPNPLGIVPMFCTKNPTFTRPQYKTKKKLMLHSTATPGAPVKNFFPGWNKSSAGASVEFVLDDVTIAQFLPIGKNGKNCIKTWHCGGAGNNTHIATEVCEPTETQLIPINFQEQGRKCKYPRKYSTQRIQMELKYLGYYTGSADGSFGPQTETAVKAYQKAKGLSVDGVVGKKTLEKLASRKGSYAAYDVASATPFFNAAYNNAVHLFAWLCTYVGAKPSEIICHVEGNAQGIASGHADVNHWFPLHGKTMNNFRTDVANAINGKYVNLGTKVDPFETEYQNSILALVNAGIINTPTYWQNLTDTVSNNNVMALLRQSGQYFCKQSYKYGLYAIDSAVKKAGMDFDLNGWLTRPSYSVEAVRALYRKCGAVVLGFNEETCYEDALKAFVNAGIINTPEYWEQFEEGKELYPVPNPSFVQAFIRQMGVWCCAQSYIYGVDAIKTPINMNSVDYWKSGNYSVLNVKYLFNAIAKVI